MAKVIAVQVLGQRAHFLHVLVVGHGVDDGAGGQEEERLEEGVREHVEDPGDVVAGPDGQEHVPELGDRRVGERLFDVVLGAGDGGRQEGGPCPDARITAVRGGVVQHRCHPGHEVDAGGDHRGGMDQGRDRRRAFHGVGQPDVERDLGRLPDGAHEQQQRDRRGRPAAAGAVAARDAGAGTLAYLSELNWKKIKNMASRKPTSPTRLVTKAFLAAEAATSRWNQKPTRRRSRNRRLPIRGS